MHLAKKTTHKIMAWERVNKLNVIKFGLLTDLLYILLKIQLFATRQISLL